LRIGNIEAKAGEHAFGFLEVTKSRSGLGVDIPIHLFAGAEPGPTLLVEAAVHGSEVIATIAILNLIGKLDPRTMSGNLIAVPTLNRMGFELQDRGSRYDGKDILSLFPGKPGGSISEQIAYEYFDQVIKQANVMIDFHAGGQTAYERYVSMGADKDPNNPSDVEKKRHKLVVAFGLDIAGYFPIGIFAGTNTEDAIEEAGVVLFTPELGGGTGWYKNGLDNVRVAERGIWNTMKAMRMVDGELQADGPLCTISNACVVLWKPNVDGLFVRKKGFGEVVKEGEIYGTIQDPYTGQELAHLYNTQEATVMPSGQNWPTVGSTSVGILGIVDRVVDRRTTDLYVSFD
jgi:predicted deacylase